MALLGKSLWKRMLLEILAFFRVNDSEDFVVGENRRKSDFGLS